MKVNDILDIISNKEYDYWLEIVTCVIIRKTSMDTEACLIIPPISFVIAFALSGTLFPFHDRITLSERFGPSFGSGFAAITHMLPFLIPLL